MSDSTLSPASLRQRIQQLVKQLPPVQRADARLHQVETEMLSTLKQRLEALETPGELSGPPPHLQALLDVSMEQSVEQAQRMLITQELAQLTGDETRILAALSDGSGFPVIGLYRPTGLGQSECVHRHSNVGRAAGIQCNDMIAMYLVRMAARGWIYFADFTESLRTDYELLEGDSLFRKTESDFQAHIPKLKRRRETLYLSPVGQQMWQHMLNQLSQLAELEGDQ